MQWPTITKSKLSPMRWFVGASLVIGGIVSYAATRVLVVGSWWEVPLALAWLCVSLCGIVVITRGATHFPANPPTISEPSYEVRVPPNSTPHTDARSGAVLNKVSSARAGERGR